MMFIVDEKLEYWLPRCVLVIQRREGAEELVESSQGFLGGYWRWTSIENAQQDAII